MLDRSTNMPAPTTRPWTGVWTLLLAAFVALLDVTMVNLAIPSIADHFGTAGMQSQWILQAYLIPLAALLLPMGRFGDALGRHRLFLTGLLGFLLGACLSGAAMSFAVLIVGRTIQGVGAAFLMPQVLALIHVILPPSQRCRAVGYFGLVSALGAIAGPLIGGVILELNLFDLGWRSVFLIMLVPSAVSFCAAANHLPPDAPRTEKALDLWHGVIVSAAIASIIYAAAQGHALDWPIWLVLLPLIGVGLLVLVAQGQRLGRPAKIDPLLPPDVMQSTSFLSGALIVLIVFCGIAGVPFLLALALQAGPQLSPGSVAIALAVHPASAAFGTLLAGRASPQNPWSIATLGTAKTCCGIILLAWAFWAASDEIGILHLVLPLTLIGLGMGISNVSLISITMALVPQHSSGAAAGVIQTAQQIGIALSIAVVSGLYFHQPDQGTAFAVARGLMFPALSFATASGLCLIASHLHKKETVE